MIDEDIVCRFGVRVGQVNQGGEISTFGIYLNQDFSKILVVLGLQNSGRRGKSWYPYKANDNINRVRMNTWPMSPFHSSWKSPKFCPAIIFGRPHPNS